MISKRLLFVLFLGFAAILFLVARYEQQMNLASDSPSESTTETPPEVDYLESFYQNPKDYELSFAKYNDGPKIRVLAATTSHHFLAKDLIAETFAVVDPSNVNTVIIVGPDHYQQIKDSRYFAQSSNSNWHTPFGYLQADNDLVDKISEFEGVNKDINLFRTEHSIYTLVPFTKFALPNVKIVPLVLRQSTNYLYFYNLGNTISKIVEIDKTIVVVSSDFSHNATSKKAAENDSRSIALLPNRNLDDVDSIVNDCKPCIAFLFGYLKDVEIKFHPLFNTNSFELSGEGQDNVTSYIGVYYTGEE